MIEMVLSTAAILATFNCQAGEPMQLVGTAEKPVLQTIGLPPEASNRAFKVRISEGDGLPAVDVQWPGDGMKLAEHVTPAFETAEGSYAFSGISVGPCLFTDKGCITQFSIVDRGDKLGAADLLIVPAALSNDPATKIKKLMPVFLRGTCQRTDLKK